MNHSRWLLAFSSRRKANSSGENEGGSWAGTARETLAERSLAGDVRAARGVRERALGRAFAGADLDSEPVGGWRERAAPARVVRARRVVGEVEVEHEPVALCAEVCALDGVEQVSAAAERARAARRVGEREIDAAAVPLEPIQLEREALPIELERDVAEAREAVGAVLAGDDVERHRLARSDRGEHARGRVV